MPTKPTIEEAASDRLLNASAIMEMLPVINPTPIFAPNKIRLQQIPTMPAIIP